MYADDLLIFDEPCKEHTIKSLEKRVCFLEETLNRTLTDLAEIRSTLFDLTNSDTGRFHIQRIRRTSTEIEPIISIATSSTTSSTDDILIDI